MFCRSHLRALLLITALTVAGITAAGTGQASSSPQTQPKTTVQLRWGSRPGVARYRLQLSQDIQFRDIVFDRVVSGTQIAIDDLAPGRYYWRIAELTSKLGEFSSPAPIVVSAHPINVRPTPTPAVDSPKPITASGGWRATISNISRPVLAHLVSPDKLDIVGTNFEGVTFAIGTSTGLPLWSVRRPFQTKSTVVVPPLTIPSRTARLDNVVIFSGNQVFGLEGNSGRELWRASAPNPTSTAMVIRDQSGSQIVVLDNTLQGVSVLNGADGRIVSQTKLPARTVGGPVSTTSQNAFAIAYENGDIEIRNKSGAVVRSGNMGSSATTAPLFISGSRGDLVLAGTRDGLTALTMNDLRPLGRVALKDDSPRGLLVSVDFESDGVSEVLMMTARRHLVAVSAVDGRILWDVDTNAEADALAFADINGDGLLDVFLAPRQTFGVAYSGRDGSLIWKDAMGADSANHAAGSGSRTLLVVSGPSGVMLIGSEPSLTEVRAISFPRTANRLNPR